MDDLSTLKVTPGKRKRGLLDLIAVLMAVYAMIIGTPVGGLIVRGWRWTLGDRTTTRPLASYFQTGGEGGAAAEKIAAVVAAPPKQDAATTLVAHRVGITADLARAVAVLAANGRE